MIGGFLLFSTEGMELHLDFRLAGYFKCNQPHGFSDLVFLSSPSISSSPCSIEDQNPFQNKVYEC